MMTFVFNYIEFLLILFSYNIFSYKSINDCAGVYAGKVMCYKQK